MCNKDTPSLQPNSMISKETTVTIKAARKTRTKTRKPKYLSLRLQLSPENSQQSGKMTAAAMPNCHHQLNLFPLHPENLVEDKDMSTHDENVEYFFPTADGGATTLTGLLGISETSSDEDNVLSRSLTYPYGGQDSEERTLVRTAMRHKERDDSEEKWVSYSEVTSCAADLRYKNETQRLLLKLDYQEILNAWSDKGPLYLKMEPPQTVPDLGDDFSVHDSPNGLMDGGWLWRVPERSSHRNGSGSMKVKEEVQGGGGGGGGGEEWKMGQREASVLRYKEKRQNRLFSKRIRYEVRKLNAEKRPRMKGRFVKSN